MDILLDVIEVKACPGYRLELVFENGEQRIFDMLPYMDKTLRPAEGPPVFNCAHIGYGTVVWSGNIDIVPKTLYDNSLPKSKVTDPLFQ
uniref:DUF2442 domain-containing protein n=1 Tax=Candidatus Kentrum sp. LFY TaxID=2126342 RepID=A0A450WIQ7_9GAMM|nr:MAG: Protein of unknown function (DUF2442) [Candidatus Kentron sp. LFY]